MARPASATALSEWLSIVWLTPAQDRLFSGTPGERRRFLDRLVLALDPAHAHHSARYEAAMRQRNRLLAEDRFDDAWLSALEGAMGEHGDAIMAARMTTVIEIARAQSTGDERFPRCALALSNVIGSGLLTTRLAESRKADAAAGRALCGPHTQDLDVRYAAKDQPPRKAQPASRRRFCSASSLRTPRSSPDAQAGRRCCCSTKLPRISIRRGVRHSSKGWLRAAVRSG